MLHLTWAGSADRDPLRDPLRGYFSSLREQLTILTLAGCSTLELDGRLEVLRPTDLQPAR